MPADTKFVIGLQTVRREKDYLLDTVDSVIEHIPPADRDTIELVIYNAEQPPENHQAVASLERKYEALIDSGFLTILTNPSGHPQITEANLGKTLRERWTAKLVLDVVFLFDFCKDRGSYYLHLEDDIIAAESFWTQFKCWFDEHFINRDDWLALSLYCPYEGLADRQLYEYSFGFFGLVFRCRDLPVLARYFERNFDRKPVDWLLGDYIRSTGSAVYVHVPSLFQHIGLVSSLPDKFQLWYSPSFHEKPMHRLKQFLEELNFLSRYKLSSVHWEWLRLNAIWFWRYVRRFFAKSQRE